LGASTQQKERQENKEACRVHFQMENANKGRVKQALDPVGVSGRKRSFPL
jgi:hypothetical protein